MLCLEVVAILRRLVVHVVMVVIAVAVLGKNVEKGCLECAVVKKGLRENLLIILVVVDNNFEFFRIGPYTDRMSDACQR